MKWFDPQKQYGFVAPDGGVQDKDDVFAHQYDVVDGGNALAQGERVEYDWAPSSEPNGRPKALRISRVATGFATRDDHFQHLRQPPQEGAFLYGGKFCRGQVMWYDPQKTFGFVRSEWGQSQQDDVFIHGNDVREASPLVPGDRVVYKALVHRGRPKAVELARDPNRPLLGRGARACSRRRWRRRRRIYITSARCGRSGSGGRTGGVHNGRGALCVLLFFLVQRRGSCAPAPSRTPTAHCRPAEETVRAKRMGHAMSNARPREVHGLVVSAA